MKRAAFILAAILLALGTLEAGLRFAGYSAPAPVLDYRLRISGELHGEPDPWRFWRLPGREPHFSPDAYRIICLADSVTVMDHGCGYPDDLPDAFARAGFAGKVEAFNAGVPEYTVYQGRVYLERELLATKPNLVTVQFGVNDHWRAPGGVADPDIHMPSNRAMRGHRLMMRSRLYQALRGAVFINPSPRTPGPYRVGPKEYVRELGTIARLCKENGATLVFVISPYLDIGQDWAPLHRRYMRLTKTTAERLNAPLVDVSDRLRFAPELFLEPKTDHIHFNRAGGRIIADAVAGAINPSPSATASVK